jgi:hypothetical protein
VIGIGIVRPSRLAKALAPRDKDHRALHILHHPEVLALASLEGRTMPMQLMNDLTKTDLP